MAIVVDRRTDQEKLYELLHQSEQEALDYKSETNLTFDRNTQAKHRLDFVKDAVAMSNRPDGGYIVFGATNDGAPCQPVGSCLDRRVFDASNLSSIVRSYVDGEVRIITQWHAVEGNELLLAYIYGHRDGLPLPMTSIGQYPHPKKPNEHKIMFHEGQIFVREGPSNAPLRHAHWSGVLAGYTERIRQEERAATEALVKRLVHTGAGEQPRVSLLVDLPLDVFAEAVAGHLRSADGSVPLRQFARSAEHMLVPGGPAWMDALDRLTLLILQCLINEEVEVAQRGVDAIFRAFERLSLSDAATEIRLAVVTRLYVLGSLAVRLEAWSFIHDMVLRPAPSSEYSTYVYASWIRQAQVDASRANLLQKVDRQGLMISLARNLMQNEPTMRPDLPDAALGNPESLDSADVLLTSLAQFDFLYCVVTEAEGEGHGGAYPACSAFTQERVEPVAVRLTQNADMRAALLPKSPDGDVAQALDRVWGLARVQSVQVGGWWGAPPAAVADYIARHLTDETSPD